MKQRGVFLIGLILITVYFFLFPRGSGAELTLTPKSVVPLFQSGEDDDIRRNPAAAPYPASGSGEAPYVSAGHPQTAVYLDSRHELALAYPGQTSAVDDAWFAVSADGVLEIMTPEGRLISRTANPGYPVSRNGRLYIYSRGAGILSGVDPSNGSVLWTRSYISPVSVLDGRGNRTLVGLLDGRFFVIDDSGETLLEYKPGGSRVEAAYGGVLSPEGTFIALIAGQDPQRFILLEERKNGFRPVTHHETGTDFRRGILIGFIRGGHQILYENIGHAVALEMNTLVKQPVPLDGTLIGWVDDNRSGILTTLAKNDMNAAFEMLTRNNKSLFRSSLPSDAVGISGRGDSLFLLLDNRIGIMEHSVR